MIMKREYRDDMLAMLADVPDEKFVHVPKEEVLADEGLIERLWALYQKGIEDYGLDPATAFDDAAGEVPELGFTLAPEVPDGAFTLVYACPECGSTVFVHRDGAGNETAPGTAVACAACNHPWAVPCPDLRRTEPQQLA